MNRKSVIPFLAGAALLALAACGDKAPQGQVVAIVNGEEITAQEVNAEAQSLNLPANANREAVLPQILQRVLDRKLLVGVARERKIDESPEFLIQNRRAEETVLATMLARQINEGVAPPSRAEVDKFIADNPNMFANRRQFQLDQLRIPYSGKVEDLDYLKPAKTMDDIMRLLQQRNIRAERGGTVLDSATAQPPVIEVINKLAPGEPFIVPAGAAAVISVVRAERVSPLAGDQAVAAATQLVRAQKTDAALKQQVETARQSAKITYQDGYGPPAAGAAAPAAGAGAAGAATAPAAGAAVPAPAAQAQASTPAPAPAQ